MECAKDSQGSKACPQKRRDIVGIIVFEGEKFLLLHRVLNWKGWEYPKGGIDVGEEKESTVGRELFEETGLKKFEMVGKVGEFDFFDKKRGSMTTMTNYLVRVSSNSRITLSDNQAVNEKGEKIIEHDDFRWCVPGEAVKLLTHDDTKASMRKAIKMLGLSIN
ncbi:MAG: NUDIX domain-containing protein [archaeon]